MNKAKAVMEALIRNPEALRALIDVNRERLNGIEDKESKEAQSAMADLQRLTSLERKAKIASAMKEDFNFWITQMKESSMLSDFKDVTPLDYVASIIRDEGLREDGRSVFTVEVNSDKEAREAGWDLPEVEVSFECEEPFTLLHPSFEAGELERMSEVWDNPTYLDSDIPFDVLSDTKSQKQARFLFLEAKFFLGILLPEEEKEFSELQSKFLGGYYSRLSEDDLHKIRMDWERYKKERDELIAQGLSDDAPEKEEGGPASLERVDSKYDN